MVCSHDTIGLQQLCMRCAQGSTLLPNNKATYSHNSGMNVQIPSHMKYNIHHIFSFLLNSSSLSLARTKWESRETFGNAMTSAKFKFE